MSETTEITTGFDEAQFEKPAERKLIDKEREKYLSKGGTIKRLMPPFLPNNFLECDVFVPNEGSHQSAPGVKDTMSRTPRPEKKFGKK